MIIKKPEKIAPSEITPEDVYLKRRNFIKQGVAMASMAAFPMLLNGCGESSQTADAASQKQPGDNLNSYEDITSYCNFYELGFGKEDPKENADLLVTKPWQVAVEGEVENSGIYSIDELLKPHTIEERIYRLRCVEAWSMVIPWMGIPLAEMIKRFKPTSRAKFVEFETIYDPDNLPGQKSRSLAWPYVEGLRIDEAMNPLTLIAIGLYGKELPNQNGAPLRVVVPWKYGFKSIKSIVAIRFVEQMPKTTWNLASSREYGFYANVNPLVDHPRWSQKRERRIGEFSKRPTLMFNGYADEVAHLYSGMDLTRFF